MESDTRALLVAIHEVAAVAFEHRAAVGRPMAAIGDACERVAAVVRAHALASSSDLILQYEKLKLPSLEPLDLDWDPFVMFDSATDERAWTEWLGSILQGGSSASRKVLWEALLEVILAQVVGADVGSKEHERLIAALHGARKGGELHVTIEAPTMDGGFLDLIVDAPGLLVGIENKLWEGWHDREDKPQDSSYRRWILATSGGVPSVAVFLSAYEAGEPIRRAGWYYVCWTDVALALRRGLRPFLSSVPSIDARVALDLWPVLCTVAAIERHLLGLHAPGSSFAGSPVLSLDNLSNLIRHLERSHV